MTVKAIWAEDANRVIGDGKSLLWEVPEDLKHFAGKTKNSAVLMGHRTWLSLPRKPLPGRRNIVASRSLRYEEGAEFTNDVNRTLQQFFSNDESLWVIGGENIYTVALPYCEELHITRVHLETATETPVFAPDYAHQFMLDELSLTMTSVSGTVYHHEKWVRRLD